MKEQKPNQLFIFEKQEQMNSDEMDKFILLKTVDLNNNPYFENFSM